MKRIFLIICIIMGSSILSGCYKINTLEKSAVTPAPSLAVSNKKMINLEFTEYTDKDNSYSKNLYQIKRKEIRKIYKAFEFEKYELMVFDGTDDSLHIGYNIDNSYFSICQINHWDSEIDRATFEQSKASIQFSTYKNVLETSGVHLSLWFGAAASNDFYFYIDGKSKLPELLLSYCTGGITEADIDLDGENELISYGGGLPTNFLLVLKREGKLMKTDYLYFNGKPIFYDEAANEFYIKDDLDAEVYFELDKKEGKLIEK